MFSFVFFVALKFVKPGEPIERVIMQQNPELEGLRISQQKLKALLNGYSDRILIILDGLDEHRLGQNEDVLKIIKSQKFLDCRIVVSSRPHSVKDVEQHFPTIIRVEGFTETEATKFVSDFFTDRKKISQILQFKPSDSRENFPVHKCPILLSFLCLLVKEEEIDLLDTNLTIGDLYFKMVQCLYQKFTIRKGIGFMESEFVEVMKSVGIIALKTLLSDNPLLQRSQVIEIVGESAFEYGMFAGYEDFRLCTDPTADICVTYAHRSLEEFFGSFGFLQALNDGKSVDDILGSDCEKPISMVNPLVLQFCLLLLTTTEFFSSQRIVYDQLVTYAAQRIDFYMLNTDTVEKMYPAMNIREAVSDEDSLKLEFFKQVFEKCKHVHFLSVDVHDLNGRDEVKGIMELISHNLLSKLEVLSITRDSDTSAAPPDVNSNALTVLINAFRGNACYLEISEILQTRHDLLKRDPQVYARMYCENSQDIKILMQKHTKQLHLHQALRPVTVSASGEFPFCPQFTHFTADGFHIDSSVSVAFLKAVKDGMLPNLRRIELHGCTMNDCEWPEVPEFSWKFNTVKMCDSSQMQKLLLKLTELTVWEGKKEPLHIDRLIHVPLENLSVLKMKLHEVHDPQCLNNVLKQGFLPNLSELFVEGGSRFSTFLDEFDPNHISKLEKLTLKRFMVSVEQLKILS